MVSCFRMVLPSYLHNKLIAHKVIDRWLPTVSQRNSKIRTFKTLLSLRHYFVLNLTCLCVCSKGLMFVMLFKKSMMSNKFSLGLASKDVDVIFRFLVALSFF